MTPSTVLLKDRHGTPTRYDNGCRCYPCAASASAKRQAVTRAIAYGTWKPFVDVGPARRHLQALQAAGVGMRRVADLTGFSREHLYTVLGTKPAKAASRIRPETERRILAVDLDDLAPGATVDSTGTRRRLQALVAVGWPQRQITERLHLTMHLAEIYRQPTVMRRTAENVRALYDALCDADPAEHGVPRVGITRARNHAGLRGWAPPHCWDDDTIDNIDAFPEWTGECGSRSGYHIHRRDGIPPCQPCKDAETEQSRIRRAAQTAVP